MDDSSPEQQAKQKAHSEELKLQASLQKTYSLSQTQARALLKQFRSDRKLAEMSRIAVANQGHETGKIHTETSKQEIKKQEVQVVSPPSAPPVIPDFPADVDPVPAKIVEWTYHEGSLIQLEYWITTAP